MDIIVFLKCFLGHKINDLQNASAVLNSIITLKIQLVLSSSLSQALPIKVQIPNHCDKAKGSAVWHDVYPSSILTNRIKASCNRLLQLRQILSANTGNNDFICLLQTAAISFSETCATWVWGRIVPSPSVTHSAELQLNLYIIFKLRGWTNWSSYLPMLRYIALLCLIDFCWIQQSYLLKAGGTWLSFFISGRRWDHKANAIFSKLQKRWSRPLIPAVLGFRHFHWHNPKRWSLFTPMMTAK